MTAKRPRPATPAFAPVSTRRRHDGWTAERQVDFIEALAECACVEEAARRVGLSSTSAYNLRRHADAQGFRQAWDRALDLAVDRLADAALSRAIHGVARPVFYQGEQIGERRDYDERLTMFLLRYRRPERYGAWLDTREARCDPEARSLRFNRARDHAADEAWADEFGAPRPTAAPVARVARTAADKAEDGADDETDDEAADDAVDEDPALTASLMKKLEGLGRRLKAEAAAAAAAAPPDFPPDVAATSATSTRPP